MEKSLKRNSSIELLKIIAIFCIILSHTEQTLDSVSGVLPDATWNLQFLSLKIIRAGGVFGNLIFWVISSWFLLEKDYVDKHKILKMLIDIWLISVVILILVFPFFKGTLSLELRYFFPTTFQNNWYLTCYIMVYAIHGWLNGIIARMNQRTHLLCVLMMLIIYYGVCYFFDDLYYSSELVIYIVIYFLVAYEKKYMVGKVCSKRFNLTLVSVGLVCDLMIFFMKNALSFKLGSENYIVSKLQFSGYHNIFTLFFVIGLFNMFQNIDFSSAIIDRLALLSMLIYLSHENILIRQYVRPWVWSKIIENFGTDYIITEVLCFSGILFAGSVVFSSLYRLAFSRPVSKFESVLYLKIKKFFLMLERVV